jgi:hypothetical protein
VSGSHASNRSVLPTLFGTLDRHLSGGLRNSPRPRKFEPPRNTG